MSNTPLQWISDWIKARRQDNSVVILSDTDLYKTGLLDSLGIIELVEALEDEYQFQFTDEEMQAGLTQVAAFEKIILSRT